MKIHFNHISKIIAFLAIGLMTSATVFGQGGEILNFDGIDDYGDMGDVTENLEELTMEVWVNPTSVTGTYGISYKDVVSSFNINNGQICVALGDGTAWHGTTYCSNTTISAGVWSHIAFSVDGDSIRIFINGVQDFGDRFTGFIGDNASVRYLGAEDDPLGSFGGLINHFAGDMDDFRIWEYGRCTDEIVNDMNCEADVASLALPSIYYTFNQGTSGADNTGEFAILDAAGTFEDATFNGFALNGGSSNFFSGGQVVGVCSTLELPNIQVVGNSRIPINEFNFSADLGNDFGFIDTLGHDSTNVFSVLNRGFTDLTVNNFALASADGSDSQFIISGFTGQFSPIIPNNGFNSFITFAPTESGVFDAEILIENDDCEDSLFIFALHGEACFDPIIDSIEGGNVICEGDSTTLTINGNLYNSGEWAWYADGFDGTFVAATQDTFLTVQPTVTTTYYLVAENGCYTNSAIDSFTVQVDAAPIINLVTDTGSDTICENQQIALYDNLFDANNDYSWSTGESSVDTLQFTAASSDTIIYVQAINPLGCPAFDSISLTVLQNPTYTLSTDTGSDTICENQQITLQATEPGSLSFGNVLTYGWSNGSTSDTAIVNPNTTTTYYVTGADANGCALEDSITITVLQNPTYTLSTDTGSDTICENQQITLQATEPGSLSFGNVLTYGWSNGSTSDTAIVNPNTTTTYYVTGANANGCTLEDSITITILSNPTYTLSTDTGSDTICENQQITLQATEPGSLSFGNVLTYGWSNGSTSDTAIVNPNTTTTYYVTGADANGCALEDSITITVLQNPTYTLSTDTGSDTICENQQITLQATEPGSLSFGNVLTYGWSNGSTSDTAIVNPNTTTTYYVTGADANGCALEDSITITVLSNPTYTLSTDTGSDTICENQQITLQATEPGSLSFGNVLTYGWSNGSTSDTAIVNPNTTTTYYVTGADANGCALEDSITITVLSNPTYTLSTDTGSDTICENQQITLQATEPGSLSFGNVLTYGWSNGSTSDTAIVNPNTTTTYYVTGADANGCALEDSITITVLSNLTFSINTNTGSNSICSGETIILQGSSTSLNYSWSNGSTTDIAQVSPTSTTKYYVTVSNSAGCSKTDSIEIFVNALPTITVTSNSPLCLGETLNLNETGGNATGWAWSGNGLTSSIQNPTQIPTASGTYKVIGTDANNCIDSTTIAIVVNTLPTITATSNSPLCLGETLNLNETGGNATGWSWTGNGLTSSIQTPTQIPTASGTYKVIGTDANNCIDSTTIAIVVNALPTITATSNSPLCLGETLNLNETGGNATTWSWTGNGLTSSIQTPTQIPTASGTYKVIGTDANNCIDSTTIAIVVNALPTITATSNSPLCLGETLNLNETGGNATTWSWTGNGLTSVLQNPTQIPTASGTYKVIGTDANNCIDSTTIAVVVNSLPTITATSNSPLCLGETLNLNETGGNATNWSWTGNGLTSNIQNPTQIPTASGTYKVIGTDANNCIDSTTIAVVVNTLPTITATSNSPLCLGETLNLNETGGNATGWSWTGNGLTSVSQTPTQIPTASGTYKVIGTDANNCIDSTTIAIVVNALPTITATSNSPLCLGETLNLNETGGNATNWSWTGNGLTSVLQNPTQIPTASGTYKVIGTDANNCIDSTTIAIVVNALPTITATSNSPLCLGETLNLNETGGNATGWSWTGNGLTSSIQNPTQVPTASGTYKVIGTDANNCIDSTTIAVTVNALPSITATSNSPLCLGETLNLNETGGNATGWSWTGNGLTSSIQTPTQIPTASGTYKVIGTDANNCIDSTTIAIVVNALPTITATSNSPLCLGETLNLNETGGNATNWSWTGNGLTSNIQNPTQIPTASGTYKVIGTDANNCIDSTTIAVVVNTLPTITATSNSPLCLGETLNLNETGGNAMGWSWTGNGLTSNIQTPTQIPTASGTYKVIGTDANNCIDSTTIAVVVNTLPTITATSNSPLCLGETLNLNETGGNATGWSWTGNGLTSNIQNPTQIPTASGTYKVIGTDANNCIDSTTIAVVVNALPTITATSNSPLCLGETLNLNETGGNATGWAWSGNGLTSSIQTPTQIPTASGTYKVIGTDANNCIDSTTIAIVVNALPTITATSNSPLCLGETLNLNETGGNATVWSWTGNGLTSSIQTPTQVPTASGTYKVIGTDANNCIDSTTIAVVVNSLPIVTATVLDTFICENENLNLTETGNEATSWTWTGPNNYNSTFQNPILTAGTAAQGMYQIEGTDGNNCSNTDSIFISTALGQAFTANLLMADSACVGDTISFFDISQTSLIPTSVLWEFGDGTTSTNRDATHIYQNIGVYNLKVTAFDQDCGNVSIEKQIHITNCVRRNIIAGESNIYSSTIAPNPARGQFQIKLELNVPDDIIIEFYNLKGELIDRKTRENTTFVVDYFYPQNPGLYLIKVRTLKIPSLLTKKVIVIE